MSRIDPPPVALIRSATTLKLNFDFELRMQGLKGCRGMSGET